MKHYYVKALFICLLLSFSTHAQHICGFEEINKKMLNESQEYRERVEQFEQSWQLYNRLKESERIVVSNTNDTIYEIPVVIHVIHTGGAVGSKYNPTDAQLIAWIDYLNQVYSAQYAGYPDSANGGTYFPIKFVLAKRDPSCNPTNGIVRINGSSLNGYVTNGVKFYSTNGCTQDDIRNLSRWPPNDYYNIYIVNRFDGQDGYSSSSSYLAGFAYLAGSPSYVDGTFLLAYNAHAGDDIFPHEIGHALGLDHVFEESNGNTCPPTGNCLTSGDKVCDTQPTISLISNYPCPTNSTFNPCANANYNGVQYNIMNYGYCLDRFTKGQRDRVILQLKTFRGGLVSSLGATEPDQVDVKATSACNPSILQQDTFNNVGPCNVSLANISYNSEGYGKDNQLAYVSHTCTQQAKLVTGTLYTLSVTTQYRKQRVVAYIDYNNDGIFSTAEKIMDDPGTATTQTHSITFTNPPLTVLDSPLRMRILADSVFKNSASLPTCADLNYGQAEDFTVQFSTVAPLAMVLRNVSAKPIKDENLISVQWESIDEENLNIYMVERSQNGVEFWPVEIKAPQGNGSVYTFKDLNIKPGVNYYYRIMGVEKNGKTHYSNVISASITNDASNPFISVYPCPFKDFIKFVAPDNGQFEIRLVNAIGQTVLSKDVDLKAGEQSEVDCRGLGLSAGIYIFLLKDKETGISTLARLLKE